MHIIHKLDEFLFTIFPEIKGKSNESIILTFQDYYTFEGIRPKVSISEGLVEIEIDSSAIISQNTDYKKAIEWCEKGEYIKAKPILNKLIEKNPSNSEYHRILGQILSDEGQQDDAINCLIDALRWDSKNGWALSMMGNIFARFKKDIPTAMKYYDQALVANPKDYFTFNNIGANLMQQGNLAEAKKYFNEVLKINAEYPNTHHALGMLAGMENDLSSAFQSTIQALKFNPNKDVLYQNSVRQVFDLAKKINETRIGKKIYKEYWHKLEFAGGVQIDIIEDNTIETAAKFEFAENYKREKHIVRYRPNYPAFEHLIMHELVHLDFVIEARKVDLNQVFLSNQKQNDEFLKSIEPTIKNLRKKGISEDAISKFCSGLFRGMNTQIYNTPIDLFIENFLYNEYAELRPYQFLSIYNMIQDGIKSVTDKQVLEFSPKEILSANRIFNLVYSLQFKDLYGIDLTKDFLATSHEQKQAKKFYDEYLTYKDDKEPAEEYELVANWAEDLKLNKFFELEGEIQYRKRQDIDTFIDAFEKDPLGLDDIDPVKEREMKKFLESQKEIDTNIAVVMFMVSALEFFEGTQKEEIKKIAMDIALQGTQGYNPERKDYRINSIKGKVFTGYHILAYYYVSFALAFPELLAQLQLPYDKEYELALSMYSSK